MKESTKKDVQSLGALPRIWAFFLLVLIAFTWRLWFPGASAEYPMIPWFSLFRDHNGGDSWTIIVGSLSSALVMAAAGWVVVRPRTGWMVVRPRTDKTSSPIWWWIAGGLVIGFVFDQHRMQPWAYQTVLYATVFARHGDARAKRNLIPVAASIYLYSALGKFDYQFTHTVGQEFLDAVLRVVGGVPEEWDIVRRSRLALLMPGSEAIIGIGLLFPKSRRYAGYAAIGMHMGLIGILGPWSLHHSWGVLIWNILLIFQAWFLFVRGRNEASTLSEADTRGMSGGSAWVSRIVLLAALVMPIFERKGYWDHWLSWSLYSPHTSRVEVEFYVDDASKLPEAAQQALQEDSDEDQWQRMSLSEWSLSTRGVPVYPQARYQRALVHRLCERSQVKTGVRVIVQGVSDRWTGKRDKTWLKGSESLAP